MAHKLVVLLLAFLVLHGTALAQKGDDLQYDKFISGRYRVTMRQTPKKGGDAKIVGQGVLTMEFPSWSIEWSQMDYQLYREALVEKHGGLVQRGTYKFWVKDPPRQTGCGRRSPECFRLEIMMLDASTKFPFQFFPDKLFVNSYNVAFTYVVQKPDAYTWKGKPNELVGPDVGPRNDGVTFSLESTRTEAGLTEPSRPAAGAKSVELSLGMTEADVVGLVGVPARKATLGEKVIYQYPDMVVTFQNGKAIDIAFK